MLVQHLSRKGVDEAKLLLKEEYIIQGVSKKTEFSGKQPWQIQLL